MVNNLCYSIECRFVRQQELQGCGFLVLMMYKTNRNRVKGQGSLRQVKGGPQGLDVFLSP